jgi:uncharacterized protein YggE
MYVNQSIQRPHGVTVFGSSLIRVEPDYASLRFAVSRVLAKPKEAFDAARSGAAAVRAKLAELGVADRDVRASEVSLEEAYEGAYNQDRRKVGYRAQVAFHALVRDLAKIEPLLVGVVDAGADRIQSVHPKSSRLRELRRDARQRAVRSALAKAEEYAEAAGAKVGAVLHIEDVNPDEMSRRSHAPDVDLSEHDETQGAAEAINPGGIVIAGAVMASFALVK